MPTIADQGKWWQGDERMSDKRQKYSELLLKMKPYDGTGTTDVSLQIID